MQPSLAFAFAADKTQLVFDERSLGRLAKSCDIISRHPIEDFDGPKVDSVLAKTEILVTGWGCPAITPNVLSRAPNLRLVAHSAGTVKHFLDPEVFRAEIAVTHAADANSVPVVEYTLAAILFANKRAFDFRELYRADPTGASSNALKITPIGNFGRTIGVVGASRIGRRLIDLLMPFDFDILLFDPFVEEGDQVLNQVQLASLDDLISRSEIVTLHAPLTPMTRNMIGARQMAQMQDGATLINTARGGLVDEEALLAELSTGRIDAILDVTDLEPVAPDSPFLTLPNVFLTPHIAGAAGLERLRLGNVVVEEIERFLAGEALHYRVSLHDLERMA
ncbi:MAG: hydroxyacid dehydrogenase [Pseudomonadota bacterium]